jgi:hypothetical protein
MDANVARHLIRVAFRSTAELQNALSLLKEQCAADEYKEYAKAIASAVYAVNTELLDRVVASHPQLRSEIDRDMTKFGRFL